MKRDIKKKFRKSFHIFMLLAFTNFMIIPTDIWGGDLPAGPDVQIGDPSITVDNNTMTIDAGQYDKTWIDWHGGFNIGVQNIVNNLGPSPTAAMLHNDISGSISNIQGILNGNLNVFLLNPNGILFSATSQINVGSFVAATLMMTHEDFLGGSYIFRADDLLGVSGAIINAGDINAFGAGGVTLLGGSVRNTGVITADLGSVNLLAGGEVTLNIAGDGSIQAAVSKEILGNVFDQDGNRVTVGVDNLGSITADGGKVYIETGAVRDVFDTLINQEGVIRARSLIERNGKIVLVSHSEGIVQNTGTLDVSAMEAGADGGTVHVLGEYVGLFGNSNIDASGDAGGGTVLIGGDFQGNGTVQNAYRTYVGSDVTINADAINTGNGGKVIVWADDVTRFYGSITARGGAVSGDGGFVEVSGSNNLIAPGVISSVDLSAANGAVGTLLLDPANIEIVGGVADGSDDADANNNNLINDAGTSVQGSIAFTDEGAGNQNPFQVYESEIEGTDANIVLQARQSITTSGTFVGADVLINADRSLTLETRNTGGDGAGGIDLTGSVDGANLEFKTQGTGTITITGSTDTGAVGNVIVGKLTTAGGAITISSGSGTVAITQISSSAGNVDIDATGNITLTSDTAVTTTSGNVDINSSAGGILTTAASNGTADIVTAGGTITLEAFGGILDSGADALDIDSGGGAVTLTGDGAGNVLVDYESANADTVTLTVSHTNTGNVTYDSLSTGILTVNASALTNGNLEIHNDAGISVTGLLNTSAGANDNLTLEVLTGNIALGNIDNILTAGAGTVTLTATAGNITVADAAAQDEIVTTGGVVLTGASIGHTNTLSLNGATALTITDLDSGGNDNINIEELTASTIATTTITVATATSGDIDINYFGVDVVDINEGHFLNSVDLSNASTSTFSYTATVGDITATLVNTSTKDLTIAALDGTVALVDLDTTTGNVDIDATGNITLTFDTAVTTTSGNVDINSSAGGILTTEVSNGTADIVTAGGTITLEAFGGILDSGADALDIDSGGGAVTLTGDGAGNVLVDYESANADTVTLTVSHTNTGNVTYDSLSTGVLTVTNTALTNGDITITNAGGMTVTGTGIVMTAGAVDLAPGGTLNVDAVLTAAGDTNGITVTGNNPIVISGVNLTTDGGVGGNIDLGNSAITLDTGAVQLSTGVATLGNISLGGAVTSATNQNLTLDAGTGSVSIASIGGAVAGGVEIGILAVTGSAGITINGNVVTDVTQDFNSAVTITTDVTFDADDDNITFDNTVQGTAVDNLTVNAGTGTITFNGNVGGGGNIGTIDLDAATLTQNAAAITGQGQVDIDVTASLTISENLTSGGATNITVTADDGGADTFILMAGKTISSIAGTLTIQADDMDIEGTITATNQIVILRSNTATDPWDFGTELAVADRLELTAAELDRVDVGAGILRIGTTTAVSGTITAAISDLTNVQYLTLAAATITDTGAGALVFTGDLKLSGAGAITIDAATTDVDKLAATSTGTITFVDADDLIIDTVDGTSGVVTTANNSAISLTTGGDLTVNQPITAHGSGTVTIVATNSAITQNSNDVGEISSTYGNITITFGNNDADVTDKVFSIATVETTGDVTINYGDNVNDNNADTLNITADTLTLTDTSPGTIASFGVGADDIEIDVDSIGAILTGEFNIDQDHDLTFNAITTTVGGVTINLHDNTATFDGNVLVDDDNDLTIISNDIEINSTFTVSGLGDINLQTYTLARVINLNNAAAGGYNLTATELGLLATAVGRTVTIGQTNGTGAVNIANDGAIDLSGENFNLTIYGGAMSLGELGIGAYTLTLSSTGAITDTNGATNNVTATTLDITATGGVGVANALETTVSNLSVINNNVVASTSDIWITNTGALTLAGAINNDGGNITVIASSPLTVAADVTATGNGNITLTATEDGGDDDTLTVNTNVTIQGVQGDITLTGGQDVTLNAGVLVQTGGDGTIDINADNEDGGPFDGDFFMNATAQLRTTGTGAITIDADDALTVTNIDSAGAITLDSDGGGTISLNGNVGNTNGTVMFSDAVSLTGTSIVSSTNGSVTFSGTVNGAYTLTTNANNGTATFTGAVGGVTSLTGLTVSAGIISAGAITTTGAEATIGGNIALTSQTGDITTTAIAANGGVATNDSVGHAAGTVTINSANDITVTTISTIGSAGLDVDDDDTGYAGGAGGAITLTANNDISVTSVTTTGGAGDAIDATEAVADGADAGAIAITATGDTTLSGNLTATGGAGDADVGADGDGGAITLNSDILLGANSIFSSAGATAGAGADGSGAAMTLNGNLDSSGGTWTWTVNATDATVTLNGNIGSVLAMGDIDVNTTSTLNLGGNVTVTGAASVLFDGATATVLDTNVTITATDDSEVVSFNTIDGAKTLTIAAGDADVDFNAAIGGTTALTGLTVSSSDTIDINAAVIVAGDVYIRSTDNSALAIDVDSTITSTAGSVTLYALLSGTNVATIDLNGDISATQNVTLDGNVTLSGTADAITATNGTIAINGNIITTGNTDLVLTGNAATVSGNALNPTPTWTLYSLDSTGVGLMTLTVALDIDASAAYNGIAINLGTLAGNYGLTLSASHASLGDITLRAADIGSLTIDDAVTVLFTTGAFETSGNVAVSGVTGEIDVAAASSIVAGGTVSLANNDTENSVGIDINGAVTGTGGVIINAQGAGNDVAIDADVSSAGAGTIAITAADQIDIAAVAAASVTGVNGTMTLTSGGTMGLGAAAIGILSTTGTGLIDIDNTGALVMGTTSTSTKISGGGGVNIAGISSIANEVVGTNSDVIFGGAVTLLADTIVGSANENVTFSSTVGGAFGLTVNASSGIVSFDSTVGVATAELTSLTVNANEARLNGTIQTDGGATADVDFRGTALVTLEADVTIDTETGDNDAAGDVLFGQSSSVIGDFDLIIDAGATAGDGNLQINDADVDIFTLSAGAVATATLYGTIISDDAIDLSGAATVTLADTASLQTTNADMDITIGTAAVATALGGAHQLTITSTGDVSFDTVTQLTALTVTADTVDFTDTVSMPGSITVTVSDAATPDAIDVIGTVDSTNGSVTFNTEADSGAALNAALSAGQNVTINGLTTLATGAIIITADNGNIDLNGDLRGAFDATLNAANGDVAIQTVGGGADPILLDINSLTAELGGATIVVAGAVDLSGVGLTTLAAATVDIDTVGGTSVTLGALTGANNLTISAGTTVALADADIASLVIIDATTVTFAGDFVTSGVTTVDTAITGTIAVTGSIAAGGAVTLENNAGGGIDINGAVTGTGGVTMTAAAGTLAIDANVTAAGNNGITLTATTADLDIGVDTAATVTAVNGTINIDAGTSINIGDGVTAGQVVTTGTGTIDIDAATTVVIGTAAGSQINSGGAVNIGQNTEGTTITIAASGITAVGNIAARADDTITVNATVQSTSGSTALTVSEDNNSAVGTVTVSANVIGDNVTITASDAEATTALITVDTTALNNNRGGYTFDANDGTLDIDTNVTAQDFITLTGGLAITLAADLTATDNDVTVNDALTLDGASIVTATSGDVTFSSTVGGARDLTVTANGTVTFASTVGAVTDELTSLTVSAATASLGGNISTDGGTADVDFSGTDAVVLTASVTIDTEDNDNDAAGDVFFKPTGTLNGTTAGTEFLAIDAGVANAFDAGNVQLGTIGNTISLQSLTVDNASAGGTDGTTTLYGNITTAGAITMTDANNIDLAADVTMTTTDNAVLLDGSDVAGDFDLAIDAGSGAVTLGLTQGGTEIDVNKLTVTTTGQTNIAGNIVADEGIDFGNATDVDITTNVTLTNIDSGTVDLTGGAVDGAFTLTITANATDVALDGIGQNTAISTLTVTSTGTTTLNDNITTANANVDLDGATNVVLGADVLIDTGAGVGGDILFANAGANSLSGGFSLGLDAGTGSVYLDNITQLTSLDVTSSATTQFVGSTDMNGAILVNNATTIDVNGSTVTTGAITLSGNMVDIDGVLTAGGTIDIDAINNVDIDANITADGNSTITLTAGAGHVNIAQNAAATVTAVNGKIDIDAGTSIDIGDAGTAGQVVTTGTGTIDIDAATTVVIGAAAGSQINSGGAVNIGQNTEGTTITIAASGITAVGNIAARADDTITVNATVQSTSGSTALTVSEDNNSAVGTVTVSANVIGDNVTITASDAQANTALITVDTTALNNNRGGYTFEADDGTLDIDSNITAQDFITLNGGLAITLAADLTAADNDITVNNALTLDGDSIVTATSGDVTFVSTISGARALTVSAASGTATFSSTVGAATRLTAFTVSAATASLNGNILTDGGATADVDFTGTDAVVLTNAITIDTEDGNNDDAGDILFKTTGTINGAHLLYLGAGSGGAAAAGGAIQLGTVGNSTALASLTVASAAFTDGITTLYGNITTAGAITMTDANNIDLAANVTMMTTNTDVILGSAAADTVDGSYTLTIDAGTGDVTLPLVGGTVALAALSVTDSDTTNLLASITADGAIYIKSDEAVAAAIDAKGAITSTGSSITLIALGAADGIDLNGDLSAATDVTLNGDIALSATADAITATNGTIAINGNITGGVADLVLTGNAATVSGNAFDTTPTWTLDSLDSTGVGLMTLTAATAIIAAAADGGGTAIDLGTLAGNYGLTLNASDVANGDIDLRAANIGSLTIGDAVDVRFNGAFQTSGSVTVDTLITGEIDVAAAGSITAGGIVTLENDAAGGIDINGAVTGTGGVTMAATQGNVAIDADVATSGAGLIDIDATAGNVNIAQITASSITAVNGEINISAGTSILLGEAGQAGQITTTGTGLIDLNATTAFTMVNAASKVTSGGAIDIDPETVTIAGGGLEAVGDITVDASDTITVNGIVNSTSGSTALTVNNSDIDVGTITVNANLIGDDVTVTVSDTTGAEEVINVTSVLNNNRGGYTFEANDGTLNIDSNITAQDFITLNGGLAITLAADLTAADNDITVNNALTLDGDSTITAMSGDVTFNSTVGSASGLRTLTVEADNGMVTFADTIGADAAANRMGAITVDAAVANLGGNIWTDNGSDVDFTETDSVVLTAAVTIDTETGDTAAAGNILFKTTGSITGDFDFDLDATVTGRADGAVTLGSVDTNSLDIDTTGITTLWGNITADDDVTLTGATNVVLAADVTILGDGSTAVLLDGGSVTGDFDLAIDSGASAVTLDVIDINKLTVTATGITAVNNDITTDEGMDFGNASNVDIAAGITLTNTDSGTIDLSGGNVDAAGALDIVASATNVRIGVLDVNAAAELDIDSTGTTTIVGNITSVGGAGGNIALDGATNVVLGADVTISTGAGAGNIDFVDTGGTNALSGAFDLILVGGTGSVFLDNITQLTSLDVTSSATTQFVGSTDMNGAISVNATTINVDGSTVTTGAITLSGNMVDIDGALTAGGTIDIDAINDVDIDANITADGNSTITLTAGAAGHVDIAQSAAAAVTAVNGNIDIDAGTTVLLGSNGNTGQIVTTGTGDIVITAATAFTMDDEAGTIVSSGGAIDIDPETVIIDGAGLLAVGNITVDASDTITVNGVVNSTSGSTAFTVTNDNLNTGTINIAANLIGDNVTVTASDTAEVALINVTSVINNNRGGLELNAGTLNIDSNVTVQDFITLSGGTSILLSANLTATDNDITVNDALTLDGNAGTIIITSTTGNVVFDADISDSGVNDMILVVSAIAGLVDFNTVGVADNVTNINGLTVDADEVNLSGATYFIRGSVDIEAGNVVLNGINVVINTVSSNGSINFNYSKIDSDGTNRDLTLEAGAGAVTSRGNIGEEAPLGTLIVVTSGITSLEATIIANTLVDLTNATNVDLVGDLTITDADGAVTVDLDGGDVAGDFNLTIDAGSGATANVTLDAIDVGSLRVIAAGTGTTSINDNITTDDGMDFASATDVDITTVVTLTNTETGTVDLSGGDVEAAGTLTINANATNVKLDDILVTGGGNLDVNATGTTTLMDNITTVAGNVAFDGATNVVLGADVVISTGGTVGDIDFVAGGGGTNSLSGGFDLDLTAGIGTVSLDNITQLTSLDVTSSATTQFVGSTDMNGAISVDATTLIDVDGTTITTGAVTLASDTNVDIDGAITASGTIDIVADNDVTVDANITTDGNYTVTITADSEFNGTGDLNIAQAAAATITSNTGDIKLEGENILLGSVAGGAGKAVSTGSGNIKITANIEGTVGAGDFTIAGTGSEVNSGGTIDVDDPWDVTIGGAGMTAVGDITVVADNDVNINAAVNSTLAGDISITADDGDITLTDEVRTTTTGDVTLLATAGYIYDADAGNETEYVAGDVVTMTAANGIGTTSDIDTQATTIGASTTGTGAASINIQNVTDNNVEIVSSGTVGTDANFTFTQDGGGGVTVTSVTTIDGNVTIDVNNPSNTPGLTVTSINAGDLVVDGDGNVTLTTENGGMVLVSVLADNDISAIADAGDITIGVVGDIGTNDIIITATTGSIDEIASGDDTVDIFGVAVTLTAEDGIGGSLGLETTITSLDASVTSVGDIVIADTAAIILTDVDTVNGSITVSAGGLLTATDVDAAGDNQDVTLTTTTGGMILTLVTADDDITAIATDGDITIDVVGDAGTDDITITATAGSINEDLGDDGAADITGDAVVLTALNEIGGITAFETEVTTISADSTFAGDIVFTELDNDGDGINLLSIDTNDGDITIVTNGGLAEAGTETLITAVRSDTNVSGVHDISIIATTGDITLSGNTSDENNVQSDNDITLEATLGSITEDATFAVQGDSFVDIVGDLLTITAQDEIGSSTGEYDIETTIATLDASSTSAGDIIITETDAIDLIDVDTANGAITIVAGDQITATDVVSLTDADANDISLTSTGAGIEARLINAGTVSGDVTLDAQAGAITQNGDVAADVIADVLTATAAGGIDLDTTVTSVTGTASADGTIIIDETNAITLTSLTTIDGAITVDAGGDMTVTIVTAGGDTGSNDVTLTTTGGGNIIQSGDITALNDVVTLTSAANITDTTDATTDISAASLVLTVPSGNVGASGVNNELDTDVDTITAAVSGNIYILENNAVALPSIVTTDGLIDIEAGGTITTTTITAGGSNGVNLYATAGNIFDTSGGLIRAGAQSTLKASGIIGTAVTPSYNPVDVNINGNLWVRAGSELNAVSVILNGPVASTARTERVEIYKTSPPGLVMLNNRLMGGGNYGSGSIRGSILSRGYGETVIARVDMYNPYYERALQPWGHKVSVPWALSETNVIGNEFMNGPAVIIDGSQLGIDALPPGLLITPKKPRPTNYYIIRTGTGT